MTHNPLLRTALLQASKRVPGLKALPVMRLVSLAEVAMLAREHFTRLSPEDRRRLAELVRAGRGRSENLTPDEQAELAALVATLDPRAFAGEALDRVSPVPLPGKRRRERARDRARSAG